MKLPGEERQKNRHEKENHRECLDATFPGTLLQEIPLCKTERALR